MNQQQLIEQKAKELYPVKICTVEHPYNHILNVEYDQNEEKRNLWIAGAEWMAGEGERLRESIDIEQLIPELMDKRVEEVMREAFGKTTILDKTIYEGENAYYLSRKQIAEDLLDKFYIIPKPQTEQP